MPDTDETSDDPDVACTLTEDEVTKRRTEELTEFLQYYEGATEHDDGVRLTFEGSAEALATVADFVGKEARCCSFASFRITYEPPYDEVALTFSGPDGTKDLVREGFFEAFDEVAPPT